MDKIPFAENLQECLPKDYTVQATEIQILAMYEDARRWMECNNRFSVMKGLLLSDKDENKIRKERMGIAAWIGALEPEIYREDMRRRMNHLREKYKNG